MKSFKPEHGALINTALYIVSVLITLAFTEMGKASFATTRPEIPPGGYNNSHLWRRRYGKLIASLKSKHSFPSGDCAQAMNLCMFLLRYVPSGTIIQHGIAINMFLFGIFLPGVAFARVFYRCHWMEDCLGGILLSIWIWMWFPAIANRVMIELPTWLEKANKN